MRNCELNFLALDVAGPLLTYLILEVDGLCSRQGLVAVQLKMPIYRSSVDQACS